MSSNLPAPYLVLLLILQGSLVRIFPAPQTSSLARSIPIASLLRGSKRLPSPTAGGGRTDALKRALRLEPRIENRRGTGLHPKRREP